MPDSLKDVLPVWQRAGGMPACQAELRVAPEDFDVTEKLDIAFDGQGEHDWLWIEKRETNTAWLARQLARFADIPPKDVGYAGLKDRHAVTRQWFSVRRTSGAGYDWHSLSTDGATILKIERHSRKLRRGAHRGNRFRLCLRGLQGDPRNALQRIQEEGVPNYFGEQRFGHGGSNIELAKALVAGRRLKREKRSIALSAARALIFNDVLHARLVQGSWDSLLAGDIAILDGTNSHFAVAEVDATLAARCAARDLHPSGPLHGRGAPVDSCPEVERNVVAAHGEFAAGLERLCDSGRRALRVMVHGLQWEISDDSLQVSFELPAGAFATSVLREFVDYTDRSTRTLSAASQ